MDVKEQKDTQDQLVLLEAVCSSEFYEYEGNERKHVLENIFLEGFGGESWAFLGGTAFELRLLLEIIANSRPYFSGRCVLAKRGMMRKKRLILPHVYYIGSTNMLLDHMNVLEYMLLINKKVKGNIFSLEKKLLQDLVDAGLGYLSLTEIKYLTAQERALITLFTALYYESRIIIMNLARLPFSIEEISRIRYISMQLCKQKKIFLFSTMYPEIAQACATNIMILQDGNMLYKGITEAFMEEYDKQILHIEDEHIQIIYDILIVEVKDCKFFCHQNALDIFCENDAAQQLQRIYQVLNRYEALPKLMKQTDPSLSNAWKELKSAYES